MSQGASDIFSMIDSWDIDMSVNDVCDNQPLQFQSLPPLTEAELFAADMGGSQPPQFQLPSQFQSLPPLPEAELFADIPPQFQSLPPLTEAELFAADMGGNQPPQFQSLPLHQPVWTGDENNTFAANVVGNQQPQPQTLPLPQFAADVCGYQQPQPQPEPEPQPVWTGDENKEFEMVIAEYLPEAMQNRWEAVAACLPGKTPMQIQEHFQKLMNNINLIHNPYITYPPWNGNLHHTSITPAAPNITIMMPAPPTTTLEHNPLSVPIINGTTPPPPPYWTDHQHHMTEVVAATANKTAAMEIMLSSSAMAAATREQNHPANNIIEHNLSPMTTRKKNRRKTVHWTEEEHRLFLRGHEELGSKWKRISEDYVKTRTAGQVASHAQKYLNKLAEEKQKK